MAQILLVEDDPLLGKSLEVALKQLNHQVTWAKTIQDGLRSLHTQSFDLLILDVNLPDGTGFDLTKQVRSNGSLVPILILTARTDEESVVKGFEAGANDYVRKPFSQKELSLRVKVLVRQKDDEDEKLNVGSLQIQTAQRRALIDGQDLNLNRREFDVLSRLAKHPDAVVRREDIIQSFDLGSEIFDRTIDSHISHIRSKLRELGITKVKIESVYGIGYRLQVTL